MTDNHAQRIGRIERSIKLIAKPGSVIELRALGVHRSGIVSGYFDAAHFHEMAQFADELSGAADGVYMTLNPVMPDLLARAANHAINWARHTTNDREILNRRWLPIDFDPVRPAGISSTDDEHTAAIERATACRNWLHEQGILRTSTVLADSGNGAHILVRVNMPNDDTSRNLIRGVLEALDLRLSDSQVKVDLTTFNAARIFKLYGTLSRKGDDIPNRPHRLAKLLQIPAEIEVANPSTLNKIAAIAPSKPQATTSHIRSNNGKSSFDVLSWIAEHKLPIVTHKPWCGGYLWVLNPCPFNPAHTNSAAFIIRHANGAIAAGCHHDGCAGKSWHDLRDLFEPGWREKSKSRELFQPPAGMSPVIAREFQNALRRRKFR